MPLIPLLNGNEIDIAHDGSISIWIGKIRKQEITSEDLVKIFISEDKAFGESLTYKPIVEENK